MQVTDAFGLGCNAVDALVAAGIYPEMRVADLLDTTLDFLKLMLGCGARLSDASVVGVGQHADESSNDLMIHHLQRMDGDWSLVSDELAGDLEHQHALASAWLAGNHPELSGSHAAANLVDLLDACRCSRKLTRIVVAHEVFDELLSCLFGVDAALLTAHNLLEALECGAERGYCSRGIIRGCDLPCSGLCQAACLVFLEGANPLRPSCGSWSVAVALDHLRGSTDTVQLVLVGQMLNDSDQVVLVGLGRWKLTACFPEGLGVWVVE